MLQLLGMCIEFMEGLALAALQCITRHVWLCAGLV